MTSEIERLIRAAQAGDAAAVDELCNRLYPGVSQLVHQSLASDIRYKRPWLGVLFSTGDVVHEVFVGVLKDLAGIRGKTEPEVLSYVATLTKNRLVDSIRFHEASRRDRRRLASGVAGDPELAPTADRTPVERAITAEQIVMFHRVMETFPERERTLLRERIENGTRFRDLKEQLGYATPDSARKAFLGAQAKLLARLEGFDA